MASAAFGTGAERCWSREGPFCGMKPGFCQDASLNFFVISCFHLNSSGNVGSMTTCINVTLLSTDLSSSTREVLVLPSCSAPQRASGEIQPSSSLLGLSHTVPRNLK